MFGRKRGNNLPGDVARNLVNELSRLNLNLDRIVPTLAEAARNISRTNVVVSGNELAQVGSQLQQCCLELQKVRQGLDRRMGVQGTTQYDSAFAPIIFELREITNILRNIERNQNRIV
jgi:hypothetical protein